MREITLREAINAAMVAEMRRDPAVFLMGEDVAEAGHPRKFFAGLLDEFGKTRVINTPIAAPGTDPARIFAAFAKGAWRQVTGQGDLSVTLSHADGRREDEGGALLLVDLTGTQLTTDAASEGLVLAIASDRSVVTLTLSFDEQGLPFATAAASVNELAARIEDPIRQLI